MSNRTIPVDTAAICIIRETALGPVIGTGFTFLRPDWVVTAKHVALAEGRPRRDLVLSFTGTPPVAASVVAAHPVWDLAVLQMQPPRPAHPPLLPMYEHVTGTTGLISIVFAPSRTDQNTGAHAFSTNHIPAYERAERTSGGGTEQTILFEAPYLAGGYSGSPLFAAGGGVVGVLTEGFTRGETQFARATSIHPLLAGLDFRPDWHLASPSDER